MRGFQLYRTEIMQIFRKLTEQGKCVIFVSHSPDVASMCADKTDKNEGTEMLPSNMSFGSKSQGVQQTFFVPKFETFYDENARPTLLPDACCYRGLLI